MKEEKEMLRMLVEAGIAGREFLLQVRYILRKTTIYARGPSPSDHSWPGVVISFS